MQAERIKNQNLLNNIIRVLLGPPVQRAIAAHYPRSRMIEFDCARELLIEVPTESAERVAEFVTALPPRRP